MKWRTNKGASLGFTVAAALLAAILICALFVSCGKTHPSATVASSVLGAGSKPAHQSPGNLARAGLEPAPTIPLADVLAQTDAYQPPNSVDPARFATLKAELRRLLTARASGAKTLSIAPTGSMNAVTDLAATVNPAGTQATLTWTEVLPGDYDNNGVVDIGDLIPLALYYGQRTDSGPDDAHRLVNGDADPEINIWDLGAIAGNYGARIQGYQVWRGHWNGLSTDWEAAFLPNIADPANTAFSIDRPTPPPVSTRPSYTYADDISGVADKNNIRYKVTAFGDGTPGADSNEASVPATTFSVSGRATLSGNGLAGVTLTLTPGGLHATTQADGTYAISGVANGAYTLTPTGTGYVSAPTSLPVTLNGANVVGLDFTATGGLANSAWPKFRGNARNTGLSPYIGAQTNHVKWTFATSGQVRTSPAIGADGTVYVASWDSNVYALNPADGKLKWCHTASPHCVESSPAVGADGTVYVGCDDDTVYALDPADGSAKWGHTTGAPVLSPPAVGADGTVYVGSCDDNVYALSPTDGSVKWIHTTGGYVEGSPAIGDDGTVYVGSNDKNVYALNPNGSEKWIYTTGDAVLTSAAVGADGTIYVGISDGRVYALNPDRSVKWSYTTGGWVESSPAVGADGTAYVGSWDKTVYALNPPDGSVKWTYAAVGSVTSSAAVGADGTVYVGSFDKNVYALNPADGSVKWSYTTGSAVESSPAIGSDGTVYVGSDDGKLYAFGGVGPSTYSVSGTVTLSGAGLAGVTMTLSPSVKTAATASDGTYKFTDVTEGTYTLTPTDPPYLFTPAQRSVTVRGLDLSSADFTASLPTYSVSGTVTESGIGLAGVTMTLTPGGQIAMTQSDGTYSIPGVTAWGYILSPSKAGYWFDPPSRSVSVVNADVPGQDFTAAPGGLANSAWPKFRGNAQNTGLSPYVGAQTNHVKWLCVTGDHVQSSPAVGVDGTVYVGSYDQNVYALNPSDGSVRWTHATGSGVFSSPAIGADGTVYIGSTNGNVYALNPSDGSTRWLYATGWYLLASPAIGADGSVYAGNYDNKVYALNPADGSVKWSCATGGWVWSSPAIGVDGTLYIGNEDHNVYAVNPADGSVKWIYTTGSYVRSSPAIGADGTVYVGSDDNNVYALNPSEGSMRWAQATGGPVESSPAVGADGTVYVGSNNRHIYALDPFDGSVKWTCSTSFWVYSSPAIGADGTVYIGGDDKNVYALNSADGSVKWAYAAGSYVDSSPAIAADGTVYIGCYDGKVYAFGP